MALTSCRECSHDVSTEAAACPHCGIAAPATGEGIAAPMTPSAVPRPVTANGLSARAGWVVLSIVVVFLMVIFAPSIWRAMGRSPVTGGKTDAVVGVLAPDGVCWTANIGGATRDGCGTVPFQVHDNLGLFSSSVQKKTADAVTVSIRIEIDGDVAAENSTSAAYGVATAIVGR